MFRGFASAAVLALLTDSATIQEKAGPEKGPPPLENLARLVSMLGSPKWKLPENLRKQLGVPDGLPNSWYVVIISGKGRTGRFAFVPEHPDKEHSEIVFIHVLNQGSNYFRTSTDGNLETGCFADGKKFSEVKEPQKSFAEERAFWVAWLKSPFFPCQIKELDKERRLVSVIVGPGKAGEKRTLVLKLKDDVKVVGSTDGLKDKRLVDGADVIVTTDQEAHTVHEIRFGSSSK